MPKILRLEEIHQIASEKASAALSKLTNLNVQLYLKKAEDRSLAEVKGFLDPKEECTGIFTSIRGDISGGALLLFQKGEAMILSDLLVQKAIGTTQSFSKLDQAALEEVGNIVSNNYLNILGDTLQLRFDQEPPIFYLAPFESLYGATLGSFLKTEDEVLALKLQFFIQPLSVNGYLIISFSSEYMDVLLASV